MRVRTIFGLLIIVAVGGTIAWLFRRAESPVPLATQTDFNGQSLFGSTQGTRGQIVPLAVGEGFSGTAFLGADLPDDNEPPAVDAADRRVTRIAGIGRLSTAEPASQSPMLGNAFPGPLEMLGIQSATAEPTAIAAEPTRTVVARPSYEETPSSHTRREPLPATHRIIDGDTLPQLAERYLGDANRAAEIYALNQDKLPSAELLPIGVAIEIPASLKRIPKVTQ